MEREEEGREEEKKRETIKVAFSPIWLMFLEEEVDIWDPCKMFLH